MANYAPHQLFVFRLSFFFFKQLLEVGKFFVVFVKVLLLGVVGGGPGIDEFLEIGVVLERFSGLVALFRDFLVAHKELGVVAFELPFCVLGDCCKFTIGRIALVFFTGLFEGCLFAGIEPTNALLGEVAFFER